MRTVVGIAAVWRCRHVATETACECDVCAASGCARCLAQDDDGEE